MSEFCSQKQLALLSITSQEQLKYPDQAVPFLHDGKLDLDILYDFCQMILLYVELSIDQIQISNSIGRLNSSSDALVILRLLLRLGVLLLVSTLVLFSALPDQLARFYLTRPFRPLFLIDPVALVLARIIFGY